MLYESNSTLFFSLSLLLPSCCDNSSRSPAWYNFGTEHVVFGSLFSPGLEAAQIWSCCSSSHELYHILFAAPVGHSANTDALDLPSARLRNWAKFQKIVCSSFSPVTRRWIHVDTVYWYSGVNILWPYAIIQFSDKCFLVQRILIYVDGGTQEHFSVHMGRKSCFEFAYSEISQILRQFAGRVQ